MDYREVHVGVNPRAMDIDSGEKRLNELGYKQELRREMVYDTFVYMCFICIYLKKKNKSRNFLVFDITLIWMGFSE